MDIIQVITRELKVEKWQVEAAVKLIDEGCTIPFISRYRKEATGSLNDEQLRTLHERLTYLRNLEDKKNQVLGSIEEQGKLTPELKKQILDAQTLVVVEDLYRPYRPKRRTRAIIAKEKGLEPLANIIMLQMTNKSLEEEAKAFLSDEKGVETIEDAINGAKDIIAEQNHQFGILIFQRLRQKSIANRGCLQCRRADIARKAMLLPHHHRRYPTQKRTAPDIQHIYRILRFTVKGMNFIGFIIMPHQQIRRIAKEHGENHHKCNTSYHNFQTLFPIHTQNPL